MSFLTSTALRRTFSTTSRVLNATTTASTTAAVAANVNSLGVVGAGQMGLGIALVAAKVAQIPVTLVDTSQSSLDRSTAFMDKLLAKDVAKQKLSTSAADAIRARITTSTTLDAISSADFIIEAVPEIPALKADIFSRLATISAPHAVLATNTSSISITRIAAAALGAQSRVVSTHFMNPVPVMRGVEIIRGLQTSAGTLATTLQFMTKLGKVPSESADTPGFLANRILMPYINEAVVCLETGVGGREDIDAIMKNGTGVPMGPLQLADFIGLDTCLAIMKVLYEDTGDSKYRPSVLLGRYVDAGWLGKKTGRGFYEYDQ
ncbi:3-hydroxyacyl-CoA dehydrogenase [Geopyxis carbonaria]|nr:3-hydroxyacyl-CoA dehydrogenase [Geopyxis carbonaria]